MEDNEECAICGGSDDELLMLSCVHDPCIKCATRHYAKQSQGRKKYLQYTCEICGTVTNLDASAIIQLEKMLAPPTVRRSMPNTSNNHNNNSNMPPRLSNQNHNILHQNHDRKHEVVTKTRNVNAAFQSQQQSEDPDLLREQSSHTRRKQLKPFSSQPRIGNSPSAVPPASTHVAPPPPRIMCRDHEDEQVSYFCFKCMVTICAQCAIHGNHQGHEVRQIKKAISEIKKTYLEFVQKLHRATTMQKNIKQAHLLSVSELDETNEKNKRAVAELFNLLKKEIQKKEKEVLRGLDEMIRRNKAIVKSKIEKTVELKQECEKQSRHILNLMKKDDLVVIEEYSKGYKNLSIDQFMPHGEDQHVLQFNTMNYNQARNIIHELVDLVSKLEFNDVELGNSQRSISLELN